MIWRCRPGIGHELNHPVCVKLVTENTQMTQSTVKNAVQSIRRLSINLIKLHDRGGDVGVSGPRSEKKKNPSRVLSACWYIARYMISMI